MLENRAIPRPGLRLGIYPQRQDLKLTEFEISGLQWLRQIRHRISGKGAGFSACLKQIQNRQETYLRASNETLTLEISALKEKLYLSGLKPELVAQAFALIQEVSYREIGKRHFENQLMCGWFMLQGKLAEMATGEGKTLATALAACTAAMAGIPVHVITANDYLASRDAESLQPLYQRFGIVARSVIDGMPTEQRRENYKVDIVYTTNKQIAFDYLRDRIHMGDDTGQLMINFRHMQQTIENKKSDGFLLRGLCFALIDEADSVLIDEAKTPLIITKTKPDQADERTYLNAIQLAELLTIGKDFILDGHGASISLTPDGKEKLFKLSLELSMLQHNKIRREGLIIQALYAKHVFKINHHYVVIDNQVKIIDEFTGRIFADRSWEQGLQQVIEAKEGCKITEQRETIAQISYQRFFGRYLYLAGTSGTLQEVAGELQAIYDLQIVRVPHHKPCKRIDNGEKVYRTLAIKREKLLERVQTLHKSHRPILIGTKTVSDSETVCGWLAEAGLKCTVLNAKQDKDEADLIAKAGHQNAITVATNMAGRGTDILLGFGVAEKGGLHVISVNKNDSQRTDRQLFGRSARQGDPGSVESILCLEDPFFKDYFSESLIRLFKILCPSKTALPQGLSRLLFAMRQHNAEKTQRRLRSQVFRNDRKVESLLEFTGKFE